VELRETVGASTGSLALLVDGTTVASGTSLDTGLQGLTRFTAGDGYTNSDPSTSGHAYVDDVTASNPLPTPTATPTNTLGPSP
jgi:hypothetical protein